MPEASVPGAIAPAAPGLRARAHCFPRRFAVLVLVACLAGLLMRGRAVVAQQTTPTSAHAYTYGEMATFSLTFPADAPPAEARFYLRVAGQPTYSYTAPTEGAAATVVRDLVTTPLPPFGDVAYWWDYAASDGTHRETEKQTLRYIDNRYTWQSATEHGIAIHWIDGERPAMVQALDVAQTALANLQWALQTPQTSGADIYVYPSQTDLLSAMQVSGLEWAGAAAFPRLSVVLIVVPPTTDGQLNMDRDIPHELTHKALYDALGAQGYASLPTWLVEGLASHFEARPNPDYALALMQAHESSTLIPLSELCAPFPDDANRAMLAYAQSGSFVAYIRQMYGWSGVRNLLAAYADGMACGTGTQRALDTDLSQLDWAWRVWLEEKATRAAESPLSATMTVLLRDAGPWLLLFGVLLLPGLILVFVKRS